MKEITATNECRLS